MTLDFLKRVSLFSDLPDHDLEAINRLISTTTLPKNSVVVQEGESGDGMYIILSGSAKIVYYAEQGREVVLSILGRGEFFGEMSLLDEHPRSATVMTLEETKLAYVSRGDFEHLMNEKPNITRKMLAEVINRLRRTSQILERVSTMDVPHRLFDFLYEYCKQHGTTNGQGKYVLQLPTHQLLADQLSTSRETISRALSALKKEEIITPLVGRGQVQVDMQGLSGLLDAFH